MLLQHKTTNKQSTGAHANENENANPIKFNQELWRLVTTWEKKRYHPFACRVCGILALRYVRGRLDKLDAMNKALPTTAKPPCVQGLLPYTEAIHKTHLHFDIYIYIYICACHSAVLDHSRTRLDSRMSRAPESQFGKSRDSDYVG